MWILCKQYGVDRWVKRKQGGTRREDPEVRRQEARSWGGVMSYEL